MVKFTYVEEYLEVIAGCRDTKTGQINSNWIFHMAPIINLARYDVNVLESMTMHVLAGNPLTERQGELALKIVLKYQRQLAAKGVDISPLTDPNWRVPLRKMDYSQELSLQDDRLIVRFPYSTELISNIRNFAGQSQGYCHYNKSDDRRVWEVGFTEYNVSWLYTWANANNFSISDDIKLVMQKIIELEKVPYRIELYLNGDHFGIHHAPPSLVDYVNTNLGGFDLTNLLKLIDASSILGYTIDPDLATAVSTEYGPRFYNLISNKQIRINPDTFMATDDFESIIDYADTVQRWPIVIYEPDLSGRMLNKIKAIRSPVWENKQQKNPIIDSKFNYIHTTVPIRNMNPIPLIISSAGLMFGGDKQLMLPRTDKVVFCTVDVYTKQGNSKVKDIAS